MALAGTDLYLVNREGVDYKVDFDAIKADILSAVPEVELEGALVYKGAVDKVENLPADAAGGEIYSVGTTYYVMAHGGFVEMGQADEVDLSGYAKTEDIPTDNAQLSNGAGYITAGDLPGGAVGGINEVLAEGNTAEALQSMRFRVGAESTPDPDKLNPDPILLEDGIGSAHRALASSWTSHVAGTGGLHSDANSSYFANYVLDEDAAPTAMAKLSAAYGLYLYQESEGPGGSWGISVDSDGIDVNDQFKVDLAGSVTAKEFIGDGSKLTNLPSLINWDNLPILS